MELKNFFNAISPIEEKTWQVIDPFFQSAKLSKGQYFSRANEVARKIAFLETGVVRAFFTNKDGKEYNKQFFVAPSIIGGYTSLLTGKPNLIPQQALVDCTIWVADYQVLTSYYESLPDLERFSRKIAEYYFLEKEKKELEIILLASTERYQLFQKEFPTLEQLIPQYYIASYLGITPIQLSRIRHQLAKQ